MEDRVRELEGFRRFLVENEKSVATIQKYLFEVGEFYDFLGIGRRISCCWCSIGRGCRSVIGPRR